MLQDMIKTNLNIIKMDSGDLFHAMKKTDPGFKQFSEVYFSTVIKNNVKAWKLHQNMTLNLIVPVGSVMFNFIDARKVSKTFNKVHKVILSQEPYFRLTVPPGIWLGFKGLSDGLNLVCNVADMIHDPDEILRKEISEIDIDWSIK